MSVQPIFSALDSRDEYEAEADIRAFRAKLAAGEEELIPAAVVDRLLAGQETRLKIWREYRGLSSAELARQAGISPSHLSQMENGQKEGSLAVLKKIAPVLNLMLDDLV